MLHSQPMKHVILAAAIALLPSAAFSQSSIGDAVISSVISDAMRVPVADAWQPPTFDMRPRYTDLPNVVTGGPIMYPIPGITTNPGPYTPDPPTYLGAPYQPRW